MTEKQPRQDILLKAVESKKTNAKGSKKQDFNYFDQQQTMINDKKRGHTQRKSQFANGDDQAMSE